MAKTDSYLANSISKLAKAISKIISDKKTTYQKTKYIAVFNHPNSNNLNLIGISKLSHIEQIEIIKSTEKTQRTKNSLISCQRNKLHIFAK
jgi:hypothetical protein